MAKQRYVRFLSRRSIVSLIGIDYPILEKSEHNNLPKFYLAGFLVLGILGISFFSAFYAFDLMFDMWHAEILLSSFFSLTFFVIYIFLIQTFSKEVFPIKYKLRFFNLSNLSRLGFVLMIGFLLAQPIKIFVIRYSLDNDIELYKKQLFQKFCNVNLELYSSDLNKFANDKVRYRLMPKSAIIYNELQKIDVKIATIHATIISTNNIAKQKIFASSFFIKRIEFAGKYPKASFVVYLVLALFFAPIVLIYSISGKSKYYELKKINDKNLVLSDYSDFKSKYNLLFLRNYKLQNIHFHEPFLDPPFNTTRKPLPAYLSQDDFFNNLTDERL